MDTTNNSFHPLMEATNHWLPFIIDSNITIVNFGLIRKKRKKEEKK
jgi:hypothetical protein